jgi:ribosomal-protein-alanine N-acetyltransferase
VVLGLLKSSSNKPPNVRLVGSRLTLRPPQPTDFAAWSEVRDQSRAFLTPWEPTWPENALSRAIFNRRLKRYADDWQRDTAYAFFLVVPAGGDQGADRLVGGLNISNIRRGVAQSGTLGYWIGEPFARRGYMSEAVGIALKFCFEVLKFHRVEAACLPTNVASRRVLGRNGFQEEGYAAGYLRINGQWCDHVLFGLTVERWSCGDTNTNL